MQDIQIIKKIDSYVKGNLSSKEVEDLWVEILKKPEYLSYLDTCVNLNALIKSKAKDKLPVKEQKQTSAWRGYGRWIAIAASLLALVGIVSYFTLRANKTIIEGVPYINKTEFESSDVLRSADQHISNVNKLLNKGYLESVNGHFQNALNTYMKLTQKYKRGLAVSKAYLNTGIIRYNNDDFDQAISAFNNAIKANENNSIIKEKVYWYKGNAFIQIKKYSQAKSALQKVFKMDGIYRKPSAELLQKLKNVKSK